MLGLAYPPTGGEPTPIKNGLCERWSDKPIAEIDGHDVHSLIDETRRSGAPGLERRSDGPTEARARVMLSCLSKMFGWLVQHRRLSQNPCKDVHRPEASRARDRVLTDAEIVKFWRATDAERKELSALLKLLLLTGCRLNEVAGMTRAELSDDGATWNIPGARTKNKRPHVVPLAPLARKMVGSGSEGFVFTTTGRSPVSGWSKIKRRLDEAMKIPPWRLHDLRRTAATGMAEIGIAPHIVEAALNHVSGAKAGVAGTYNRAAYAEEKRAALERWASHVQGLVSERPANVVKMRKSDGRDVSGRRRSTSERRLTQNQIVDAAVKIIGEGIARRADVQAIVEKMSKMCERWKRARSSKSKNQKQFAKQYGLALRKVIVMTDNAPTDFRAPSPLPVSAPQLGIDKEWFDHERLLRHLKLLHLICEGWERSKLGSPSPTPTKSGWQPRRRCICLSCTT